MPKTVSKPKKGSKPKKRSKLKQSSKLKKVHKAPSIGTSALQERALELIGLKSEGVYQSELRKQLEIDSAKCSKIVSRLEGTGLIYRQPADYGRRRTYLIRLNNISKPGNAPQDSSSPQPGNAPKSGNASSHCSINHIDTYLTEFYLLYLIRGSSSA